MKKVFTILLLLFIALPCFARRPAREARREVRCIERMNAGMEAFERGRYARAVNYFSVVRDQCSGDFDAVDSIYFHLGLSYMRGRRPEEARMEFRTIIEDFPHSEFIERTYFYIALSSFNAAPIIQRDPRLLRRAQREFSAFLAAYPNSEYFDSAAAYLDSISHKLLEREIMIAEFYEVIRRFESAVLYYEAILSDFPGNSRIPEIRMRLARSLISANRFAEALAIIEYLEGANLFADETEIMRRRINQRTREDRINRRNRISG